MKAFVLAASLLVSLPCAAAAAEVFGSPQGCDRHAGRPVQGDGAVTLSDTEFAGHESRCPITGAEALNPSKTRLVTTCSGEGDTWEQVYIRQATSNPKVIVLYAEDSPSGQWELTLCE